MFLLFILLAAFANAEPLCKAYPGSPIWPSLSRWAALNASISGRLLQPPPPGAVCHPGQPTYNSASCVTVQNNWTNIDYHSTNPISSAWNNWNNESCIPYLPSPCSGEGYPIYVVNATCIDDVKKGVDFARENHVRLIVKASGHDYLGRSTAPNSLSIWTRNLQGIQIQEDFRPTGCQFSIDGPSITFGAGNEMGALNAAASLQNLTILSGGQDSVNYGGYASGAGHGALSATYGLAADNVLEMEVVTPGGEILTINECQNQDLFWANRGGGGSTFGVVVSTTIKAFPSAPFYVFNVLIGTEPNTEAFWDAMTYWMSQYPSLADQGIAGYGTISPNTSYEGTYYGGFQGEFILPGTSSENTSESLAAPITKMIDTITTLWPGLFVYENTSATWPTFYDWWLPSNGPDYAGVDLLVGSRLLDAEALTGNLTALKIALQGSIPPGPGQGGTVNFVSGKGVWNAVPRGGSDAVNPAWRSALLEYVTGVSWTALNETAKDQAQNFLTNTYVEALRVLAPGSGAYVNEADPYEPNFQQVFWGDNYPRLLDIKRLVDPGDVFWCTPCVGNERWEEVGNLLCRV